jgi:hypothetical protein
MRTMHLRHLLIPACVALSAGLAGATLTIASAPSAAAKKGTLVLKKGDDGWVTVGGGKTTLDLADYPIASALGGKLQGSSKVSLEGRPLEPSELGSIDTLLTRPDDIRLQGGKGRGRLSLVALSVAAKRPVVVGGHTYKLAVVLSESSKESPAGTIVIRQTGPNGGTFDADFPVVPRLVFTEEATGQTVTIDCGSVPCGGKGREIVMTSRGVPWTLAGGPAHFDPAAHKIIVIPSGVRVGGKGVPAYTTVGTSNFVAGFGFGQGNPLFIENTNHPSVSHFVTVGIQAKATG